MRREGDSPLENGEEWILDRTMEKNGRSERMEIGELGGGDRSWEENVG